MTEPLDTLQEAEDRHNALHEVLTLLEIAHRLLPDDPDATAAHEAIDAAVAELDQLVEVAERSVNEHAALHPTSTRTH